MIELTSKEKEMISALATKIAKRHNFSKEYLLEILLTSKIVIHQEEPYTCVIIKKKYKGIIFTSTSFAKYNYDDAKIDHFWDSKEGREIAIIRAFRKLVAEMEEQKIFQRKSRTPPNKNSINVVVANEQAYMLSH